MRLFLNKKLIMKKINFLALISMLSLLVLSACKKDDDPVAVNEFTVENQSYELAKGFIEPYGENTPEYPGSYDFDITLTSSSINYSDLDEEFNGTGHIVYLDLNTSSPTGLVSGTYNFSSERNVLTIVDGTAATNFDIANGSTGSSYEVIGGTVTITTDATEPLIEFSLITTGNITVTGRYKGTLRPI